MSERLYPLEHHAGMAILLILTWQSRRRNGLRLESEWNDIDDLSSIIVPALYQQHFYESTLGGIGTSTCPQA
jgi:hypothetical protein